MSRITAPVAKLSQAASLSYAARTSTTGAAAAPSISISQKYADLLRTREHQDSRNITTTHRPTPQPSLSNRKLRLMQSFSSSTSKSATVLTDSNSNLGATTLPHFTSYSQASSNADLPHRIPLLPDSYATAHATPFSGADSVAARAAAEIPQPVRTTIVAADPSIVVSGSGLAEVNGGFEGVDLGFVHEENEVEREGGMIKDVWRGL